MRSLTKIAALAALGLAALAQPSQAATLALPYDYSFLPSANGYLEQLTISDPFSFDLSNVNVTETLLSDPTINGTTNTLLNGSPLSIAAGTSVTSDTGLNLPTTFALPFGPQPQNVLFDPQNGPLPFTLSATAQGNGQTYAFSLTQGYNPNGTPNAVPEPGTTALLAAGLGLLGVAGLRRKRLN